MGSSNYDLTQGRKRRYERHKLADKPVNYASVSAEEIKALVCAITRSHGAVRFGYTSDGGAYAIGIYGDGEPYTEYVRPGEDMDKTLHEMTLAFHEPTELD